MLLFENKGKIDMRTVTTFGVSVKEKQNAFGYFGTGLKYAIAVILRNGGEVVIHSGLLTYKFFTEPTEIRGQEFNLVKMQKGTHITEMPFTTELGKNWELWQAFRELYCNTMDEPKAQVRGMSRMIKGKDGFTRIVVRGLDEVYENKRKYIIETEPLYTFDNFEVHMRTGGGAFYYNGVKVYQPEEKLKYNYNFTTAMDLTEDRTLAHPFMADYWIKYYLMTGDNIEFITEVMSTEKAFREHNFDYEDMSCKPSDVFMSIARSLEKSNSKVHHYYSSYVREHMMDVPASPLTQVDREFISSVKALIKSIGFEDKYTCIVTDTLRDKELVIAQDNIIYLSAEWLTLSAEAAGIELYLAFLGLEVGDGNVRHALVKKLLPDCVIMSAEEEPTGERYWVEGTWSGNNNGASRVVFRKELNAHQYEHYPELETIIWGDGTSMNLEYITTEAGETFSEELLSYEGLFDKAIASGDTVYEV